VKASLSPAEPLETTVDKANKRISVIVADDQLSIGIGKHGQNVRLASRLIGWEIDIRGKEEKAKKAAEELMGKSEPAEQAPEAKEPAEEVAAKEFSLTSLEGVGPKTAGILKEAGYDTAEKLKKLTLEDLTKLQGIGEKTAEKIIKAVKDI
jgi:N utilization substance protein A